MLEKSVVYFPERGDSLQIFLYLFNKNIPQNNSEYVNKSETGK
jgi:hypothetical protein